MSVSKWLFVLHACIVVSSPLFPKGTNTKYQLAARWSTPYQPMLTKFPHFSTCAGYLIINFDAVCWYKGRCLCLIRRPCALLRLTSPWGRSTRERKLKINLSYWILWSSRSLMYAFIKPDLHYHEACLTLSKSLTYFIMMKPDLHYHSEAWFTLSWCLPYTINKKPNLHYHHKACLIIAPKLLHGRKICDLTELLTPYAYSCKWLRYPRKTLKNPSVSSYRCDSVATSTNFKTSLQSFPQFY